MIAVHTERPQDAGGYWDGLIEYLGHMPEHPDTRRRDLRAGAVLLAIAAGMVVQSLTGVLCGPDEWFDVDITPLQFGLFAMVPAAAGIGFLIASALVRPDADE